MCSGGGRRGALQLWQFLVSLLAEGARCVAWTGRGLEFKLHEPEEVRIDTVFCRRTDLSMGQTVYSSQVRSDQRSKVLRTKEMQTEGTTTTSLLSRGLCLQESIKVYTVQYSVIVVVAGGTSVGRSEEQASDELRQVIALSEVLL